MMIEKTFTLAELAELTHSKLVGDPAYQITNIADLESASCQDVSFLANPHYEKAMRNSEAGVVFISPQTKLVEGRNFLITDNPSHAFQITVEAFLGEALKQPSGFFGIHPTAVIHETAVIGKNVTIGPHAVIDRDAYVGDHTTIDAHCYIGAHVIIGNDCHLYPHVVIRERCRIGDRVILQPGVVIGSCGFGYITNKDKRHLKLNQVGIVVIEDDVEIGANATIDRSRFKSTVIGRGTKIDNLVQIGHGVLIGEHNIIVAQTGIAGSSKTGNHVIIGGQVAIAGHLSIADGAMIAGRSGVAKSIQKAGKYGGLPLLPLNEYQRNQVYLRNIQMYIQKIQELEKRIEELEA